MRRPLLIPFMILLAAALVALPACKKKPVDSGGDPTPAPGPGGAPTPPPAGDGGDPLLVAHLDAKHIRDSAIFTELKQAFEKAGGTDVWDKAEADAGKELGFKLTDIDSVTAVVPDAPMKGGPKFILILSSSAAFNKATAFGLAGKAQPDTRGFYKLDSETLLHYPDDKTAAVVHPDLAQKYLDGYAKDRKGWPMTAVKGASGHTLYASVNLNKIPAEAKNGGELKDFQAALAAQSVTIMADLKGKELTLSGHAKFPDAASASKAKDLAQNVLKTFTRQFEQAVNAGNSPTGDFPFQAVQPVIKAAQRTLQTAKLEASGSSVSLSASFKADFDIGSLATEFIKYYRDGVPRLTAQNNLKQIGLALHGFHSANGWTPTYGIGAKNGQTLLSWRVAILPYIEQDNLYRQFKLDEPWDSPNNKKLIEQMPKIFAPVGKPGKPGYTHLQMVVGPNAMPQGAGLKFNQISDGLANTIAVVEAAEPVIWTKPDDIVMPGKEFPKDFRKKFGGQFPGGFHALMWDGSVRFVPDSVSDRTLAAALSFNGGEVLGPDWNAAPQGKK